MWKNSSHVTSDQNIFILTLAKRVKNVCTNVCLSRIWFWVALVIGKFKLFLRWIFLFGLNTEHESNSLRGWSEWILWLLHLGPVLRCINTKHIHKRTFILWQIHHWIYLYFKLCASLVTRYILITTIIIVRFPSRRSYKFMSPPRSPNIAI